MIWLIVALAAVVLGYLLLPELVAVTVLTGSDRPGTVFYRVLALVFLAALMLWIAQLSWILSAIVIAILALWLFL